MVMATVARVAAVLLGYCVCWAVAYVFINRDLDLRLMAEYFVSAWTFHAFVRPAFVQAISVALFLAGLGLWALFVRLGHVRHVPRPETDAAAVASAAPAPVGEQGDAEGMPEPLPGMVYLRLVPKWQKRTVMVAFGALAIPLFLMVYLASIGYEKRVTRTVDDGYLGKVDSASAARPAVVSDEELKESAIQWLHDHGKELPVVKEFSVQRTGGMWKVLIGDGVSRYIIDYHPTTGEFVRVTEAE